MSTIEELERVISRDQSIVVDSAMFVSNVIPWSRAVSMVLTDEAYIVMPRSDGSRVHSVSMSIPLPLVIGLMRYVPRRVRSFNNSDIAPRRMVLARDGYVCQYCGSYGNTIDHIVPRSRGGQNTWGNLCCACKKCNNEKSDRTPEEAGMRTPEIPHVYQKARIGYLQSQLYKMLEESIH